MENAQPITILIGASVGTTQFTRRDDYLWLARLCGMLTGRQGEDTGPVRTQGVALIHVDGRRYEGRELALDGLEESAATVMCRWRVGETPEAAFHGRMLEFAKEVRAAGLGFGLWMEPERFGPAADAARRIFQA